MHAHRNVRNKCMGARNAAVRTHSRARIVLCARRIYVREDACSLSQCTCASFCPNDSMNVHVRRDLSEEVEF